MNWFQLEFDQHLAPESGKNKISSFWRAEQAITAVFAKENASQRFETPSQLLLVSSQHSTLSILPTKSIFSHSYTPGASPPCPSDASKAIGEKVSNSFPVFQEFVEKLGPWRRQMAAWSGIPSSDPTEFALWRKRAMRWEELGCKARDQLLACSNTWRLLS